MELILGIIGAVLAIALIILIIVLATKRKNGNKNQHMDRRADDNRHSGYPTTQINQNQIAALAEYVALQKKEQEEKDAIKFLKKQDQKQKLENFRQTKDSLKNRLKNQFDSKEWVDLERILKSLDKGGIGIYMLYNHTKNKYYIGQAKQLYKRIKDHFVVNQIALDRLNGDQIYAKFITANELDSSYRLDHIEKIGIELYNSDKTGYNKTQGNI